MSTDLTTCPHCGQAHRITARFCPITGNLLQAAPGPDSGERPSAPLTGRIPSQTLLNNRYSIVRKIGEGGMASVYQTTDSRQPGVIWAVKEMSAAAITNPQELAYAVRSFQQEANLLRTLNHPNLPKVVDFFTESGKHFLVMEFVPGKSLGAWLTSRREPFPESQVLQWAIQLCDVLSYLHTRNPPIIFRDLKPSNIMLTPQGQIKLIDFGIVRFFKPGKTRDTLALGTPGYSAPEATHGQTDERSDIYSLCVTLHQTLTYHDPGTTIFSLPPARQVNPGVSPAMEQILTRGTQLKRERRWTNVNELRAALSRMGVKVAGIGTRVSAGEGAIRAAKTSRPTTRLVQAAAKLSAVQLALLSSGLLFGILVMTWALAPILDDLNVNWNNVPFMAIFGALGYAAYPKRAAAFIAHSLLTTAMVATVWARVGEQSFSIIKLIFAVIASGLFMEFWLIFIGFVRGKGGKDAWMREAVWLVGMSVIGMALFFGIITNLKSGYHPLQLLFAAFFGGAGWFLGDLIQQYFVLRRTGASRN